MLILFGTVALHYFCAFWFWHDVCGNTGSPGGAEWAAEFDFLRLLFQLGIRSRGQSRMIVRILDEQPYQLNLLARRFWSVNFDFHFGSTCAEGHPATRWVAPFWRRTRLFLVAGVVLGNCRSGYKLSECRGPLERLVSRFSGLWFCRHRNVFLVLSLLNIYLTNKFICLGKDCDCEFFLQKPIRTYPATPHTQISRPFEPPNWTRRLAFCTAYDS